MTLIKTTLWHIVSTPDAVTRTNTVKICVQTSKRRERVGENKKLLRKVKKTEKYWRVRNKEAVKWVYKVTLQKLYKNRSVKKNRSPAFDEIAIELQNKWKRRNSNPKYPMQKVRDTGWWPQEWKRSVYVSITHINYINYTYESVQTKI